MLALLLIAALPFIGQPVTYRPHGTFEGMAEWHPDPIEWESGVPLRAVVTRVHADGRVDVVVTGSDGRKHKRERQKVLEGFDLYFGEGGVILPGAWKQNPAGPTKPRQECSGSTARTCRDLTRRASRVCRLVPVGIELTMKAMTLQEMRPAWNDRQ